MLVAICARRAAPAKSVAWPLTLMAATGAPVASLESASLTQTGAGGALFKIDPGADVTLPGSILTAVNSEITTGGSVLTVGAGASPLA